MRKWVINLVNGRPQKQKVTIPKNKHWDGRNYYQPYDEDKTIIFDCPECGDPTAGSFLGPIVSNLCWTCNIHRKEDAWQEISKASFLKQRLS